MELSNVLSYLKTLFLETGKKPVIFSSVEFWLLSIVVLAGLVLLKRDNRARVAYIVLFNLFFFYKANGLLVFLMLLTSFVDWRISRYIFSFNSIWRCRIALGVSLAMNLGLLVYFKYSVFLAESFGDLFSLNIPVHKVVLPVGISFYTFQSVGYVVDVFRGQTRPAKRWIDYLFFISFFPILISGPIMRASRFLPQIEALRPFSSRMMWGGFWLLLVGIVKKSVFADYIMQFNMMVFDSPSDYSGLECLLAVIGYSAQIYCDFSGYSDMAIGVGAIFGYDLGVNFDRPYRSLNLTEFWRRWHISLSSWLRDYLYIPLGGNRCSRPRMYFNLLLTMLVAGIWHGASWLFVLWGLAHGFGLVVHKAVGPRLKRFGDRFPLRLASGVLTFAFVTLLWPLFACHTLSDAAECYSGIFTSFSFDYMLPFAEARMQWLLFVIAVFISQMLPASWIDSMKNWFVGAPLVVKFIVFVGVVLSVVHFSSGSVAPFIYMQF